MSKIISTKEAQDLRIEHSLGARVNNIFYDKDAKFHRVSVSVSESGTSVGRTETHNYYVHSTEEVFSQQAAVGLATTNFLGKTHHFIVNQITPGNVAQSQENSDGKESLEESSQEVEVKEPVKQKGKGSSKKAGSTTAAVEAPAAEEMEEVESPYKPEVKAEKVETKAEKLKRELAEAEAEEAELAAAAAKAKTKAVKATLYNRTDGRHVDILTSFLDRITGSTDWKKNPNITQFSISLVGKDFIDGEGKILPSFEADCKKFFGLEKVSGL